MPALMQDKARVIIEDFAKEIERKKLPGAKPSKIVINFRKDQSTGNERDIFLVPTELLRYRKDNGRISSDVISYENENLVTIDESSEESQKILCEFLAEKDKEMTEILKNAIKRDGQLEPAIITVDGFLINGNRRKMVLEQLHREDPTKYDFMKVVILPGPNDQGGPPTIKEIELIENRYQLQQDGRSEYKGLDRALSISRKIACGISLNDQLADDNSFAGLLVTSKEFQQKKKEFEKKYLLPLARANDYLESINRPGCYDLIEERWQAFIDYSNFYNGKLKDSAWQTKAGVSEDDIGKIEDVAFKIIRKKTVRGRQTKLHQIMRDLPNLLLIKEAKGELLDLNSSVKDLTRADISPELSLKDADAVWGQKNETVFSRSVNMAYSYKEIRREDENALNLIRSAYKKLTHENMDVQRIPKKDLEAFVKESDELSDLAKQLRSEAWVRMKGKTRS